MDAILVGIYNTLDQDVEVNGVILASKKCRCFSVTDQRVKLNYAAQPDGSWLLEVKLNGQQAPVQLPPSPRMVVSPPHGLSVDIHIPAMMQLTLSPPLLDDAVGCGEGSSEGGEGG